MKIYSTSDLPIAAWLKIKGLKLVKAEKNSYGHFVFEFDDPNDVAHQLAIDFINSECSLFDNEIRNLKKLLYNRRSS
jgi:hypothetical protein